MVRINGGRRIQKSLCLRATEEDYLTNTEPGITIWQTKEHRKLSISQLPSYSQHRTGVGQQPCCVYFVQASTSRGLLTIVRGLAPKGIALSGLRLMMKLSPLQAISSRPNQSILESFRFMTWRRCNRISQGGVVQCCLPKLITLH